MLNHVRTKAFPAALTVAISLTAAAARAQDPAGKTASAGSAAPQTSGSAPTATSAPVASARASDTAAASPAAGADSHSSGGAHAEVAAEEGPRKSEAPYPWAALIPFGGGQFLRGADTLGMFFGDGEVLLGAASIGTAVWYALISSNSTKTRTPDGKYVDLEAVHNELSSIAMANRLAFSGWAALTAAGIFEALVNNHPSVRGRRAAAAPSFHVSAGPADGGAGVSLRIVF
ncbi:MAG: hypothetical protein U0441_23690 [Polyangiaceae bacterium]